MKNILKVATLGSVLLCLFSVSAQAQNRYATVDLQRLIQNFWQTKQAMATLKDRATELDKTRKEIVDRGLKVQEDYKKLLMDANDQAVTAEEREKRKTAAQTKLKDLQEVEGSLKTFDAEAQSSLDEMKRRLTDNIFTQVRKVVGAKAKSAGYAMVFDTTTPIVVYNSGENDITDAVLTDLNATAPVEMTTKPKTTTPSDKK